MQPSKTKPSSARSAMRQPSQEFSEALKQELLLTSRTLGTDLDEVMVIGYLEALCDIPVEHLREAFKEIRRECGFHAMPVPREIRDAATAAAERAYLNRPRLPEPEPEPLTEEDRAVLKAEFEKYFPKRAMPQPLTTEQIDQINRDQKRKLEQYLKAQNVAPRGGTK